MEVATGRLAVVAMIRNRRERISSGESANVSVFPALEPIPREVSKTETRYVTAEVVRPFFAPVLSAMA